MMDKKKKRQQPEHKEQVKYIKFLEQEKTYGRVLKFSATLNGVWLPIPLANLMRSAGMREGPLDVIVLLPKVMLWVEMKLPKRVLRDGSLGKSPSRISPEQIEWARILNTYTDVHATIAYGALEAIKFTSLFIPNAGQYSLPTQTDKERNQSLESFSGFINGNPEM